MLGSVFTVRGKAVHVTSNSLATGVRRTDARSPTMQVRPVAAPFGLRKIVYLSTTARGLLASNPNSNIVLRINVCYWWHLSRFHFVFFINPKSDEKLGIMT